MQDTDYPIVDMLTLRRDLYLVMSLLLADKKVTKVTDWTQDLYENEARRLMLWVATAARGLLNLTAHEDIQEQGCGEYHADFPNGEGELLTFRQACNSVIHAKEILLYKVPQRESKGTVKIKHTYIDRITIRSSHRNKTTRAQLDIIRFVQTADLLINSFEENDHANL